MKLQDGTAGRAQESTSQASKAAAIISGGLDSVTLAHLLASQGYGLHLLSFDYGQRHRKELDFAQRAAARLGAEWTLIDLKVAGIQTLLRGSALTDPNIPVPECHYAADNMRITIVPNRNAIMLAIACAAAESNGAQVVGVAVHAGDHFIYPDCRPEFIEAFQAMERLAMDRPALRIEAPFSNCSKADIVRIGADLNVPFSETWSCYVGDEIHCGACGTCVERREAFLLAGVTDPTKYLAEPQFEAPAVG